MTLMQQKLSWDEAGWKEGEDGIREKDGVKAEMTLMFSNGDSVRQALAEDTANQLKELGISVKTEGVGWDTAYDRAQGEPLMWGWGAHTPMELYNIYHTIKDSGSAEYSPYANETVDKYMDEALKSSSLEESYDLWKKAQWDGTTGITQEGDPVDLAVQCRSSLLCPRWTEDCRSEASPARTWMVHCEQY